MIHCRKKHVYPWETYRTDLHETNEITIGSSDITRRHNEYLQIINFPNIPEPFLNSAHHESQSHWMAPEM